MQKVHIAYETNEISLIIFKNSTFFKILGLQIISWDLDLGFRNKENILEPREYISYCY